MLQEFDVEEFLLCQNARFLMVQVKLHGYQLTLYQYFHTTYNRTTTMYAICVYNAQI